MTVSDKLLKAAKNYMDITWEDEAGDEKLSGILLRGMQYLTIDVAGIELDFDAEGKPQELLFEYAKYARAGALDEYQTNYLHELLKLQINAEVGIYDKSPETP